MSRPPPRPTSVSRRAALALACLTAACGYRAGFVLPEDVSTVGVEIFSNDSKVRDLERELHGRITDSLARLSAARIVDPREADLVFRGRIVDYARRGGIRSPDNVRLETGLKITIEALLVRADLERIAAAAAPADAAPAPPEDGGAPPAGPAPLAEPLWRGTLSQEFGFRLEEVSGEDHARERVLRSLADRIVLEALAQVSAGERSPLP